MDKNRNNDKRNYVMTRETLGMTILLFCLVLTIILLTNNLVFLGFGKAICTFMYGTFGYASYFVVACLAYLGEWLVFERKLKFRVRPVLLIGATVLMLFLLFHSVSTAKFAMDGYGSYLAQCFKNAENGYSGYTFGGVLFGLVVYPIAKGITFIGAYVIFSLLTVVFGALSVLVIRNIILGKAVARNRSKVIDSAEEEGAAPRQPENQVRKVDNLYSVNENHEIVTRGRNSEQTAQARREQAQPKSERVEEKKSDDKFSRENLGRKILFENGEFAAESYRRNMIYNENSYFNHPVQNEGDYLRSFSSGDSTGTSNIKSAPSASYTEDYSSGIEHSGESVSAPNYVYSDEPVQSLNDNSVYGDESGNNPDYNSYTVGGVQPDYDEILREEADEPTVSKAQDAPIGELRGDPYGLEESEYTPVRSDENLMRRSETTNSDEESAREQPIRHLDSSAREGKPAERKNSLFNLFSASNPRLGKERRVEPDVSAIQSKRRDSRENLFDDDNDDDNPFGGNDPLAELGKGGLRAEQPINERDINMQERRTEREDRNAPQPEKAKEATTKPAPASLPVTESKPAAEEKPKHVWKKYVRPSLELLDDYPENTNVNTAEIEESKQIICETLADYRIECRISNVVVGPAITRYDVIIEDRTNIKNALKYREAIAMALMKDNVNAYLNYSKGAISIEVPNSSRCVVGLKSMLASSQFLNAKANSLTFTLGKNVEGQVVCPDITKMPHLLVAGTTGSGKSICLSTLLISLLYKYGPEELRFILVDPKQVEFISYDKLPHLMINEIIYEVDKAIKALNWAIKEMERRYALFKEMTEKGVATKNLTEYNAHLPEGEEKLPKIVVILDEFGDLMLQAKKDIESRIIRLVQKSRACGIHLILATQRPSVDCITGLIKSNLPTRIGFKVNSFDDARCIFDIGGAEKLLGKGDLYFRSAENPELARIQGCFVDTHEVQKVTDFIKQNNETYFDQSVSDFINTVEEEVPDTGMDAGADSGDSTKVDDTFIKALKFCVTSNQASVSMIQRRFPIGYMKACKIIDWMENMNYITQAEGSKPRKVLLSRDEFIQRYGDVDD